MPIALIIIGLIMFVAALTDRVDLAATTVADDIEGFAPFLIALLMIGALGAIKEARPVADAFLALIFVVLLAASGAGETFWGQIEKLVKR